MLTRIGHIRIEGHLGKGGMGEVWAGFDELLERPVAVKVLTAGRLGPQAKARFLREARMLSRLDHPGICRVWALHELPDADYLILELIQGDTLDDAAEGLDFDAKLEVACELAAALAAAHGAQVIHRDIKPSNLMVTRQGRAKILDFGIARNQAEPRGPAQRPDGDALDQQEPWVTVDLDFAAEPLEAVTQLGGVKSPTTVTDHTRLPDTDPTLTVRGAFVGTPQYTSPEQARGEPLTTASDVYALALVFRLLFGRVPGYSGNRPAGEILQEVQRGQTAPLPPMHPEVARLVTEMEALDPALRPSAGQVAERLAAIRSAPLHLRRRRRLGVLAAIAVSAVLAVLAGQRWLLTRPLVAAGKLARVAVPPFIDRTGDPTVGWLSRGLVELVSRQLDDAARIEVLDPAETAALSRQLTTPGQPLTAEEAERLAAGLGVRFVIATTVAKDGAEYQLDATLFGQGDELGRVQARGADLVAAGEALASRLAARLDPNAELAKLGRPLSADHLAATAYAIGLSRAETTGPAAAEAWFRVAVDRDSGFGWARLQLAETLQRLGRLGESEELLSAVRDAAQAAGDRRLLAKALASLGDIATERADYAGGRALLEQALVVQRETGDRPGAVRTLNSLGRVARREGDHDAAERLWRQALAESREIGQRRVEAVLLGNLALVGRFRGQVAEATEQFEASRRLAAEVGDRDTEARGILNLGDIAREQGRYADAKNLLEAGLAVHRATGNQRDQMFALGNLAIVARLVGDLDEAERKTTEVLAMTRSLGDRQSEAHVLADIAELSLTRGRTVEAEQQARAAVELAQAVGAREIAAYADLVLARVLARSGRREEALVALDRVEAFVVSPESSELRRELSGRGSPRALG